jgi:membrane-associated protein
VGAMTYPRFLLYSVAAAIIWVGIIVYAGYFFGNVPIVKQNFSLVTIGIVVVSLLPVVVSAFRRTLPETQSG